MTGRVWRTMGSQCGVFYLKSRPRDTHCLSSLPPPFVIQCDNKAPELILHTIHKMSETVNRQRGAVINVDLRVEFLAISNTPPLERERIEMRETLVRVRVLIEGLSPKQVVQRAKLEAYAAKLASVIHPIRSVPPEILSEIFSHLVTDPDLTCQDVKDDHYVDSLDTKRGVWALTHVCSRWRKIVTNTSSWWTTVGLPFDIYRKSSVTADILATYLERSKQRPLNVIIHSRDEISTHPAMEVLMKTCDRWRGGWFALPLDTYLAWQTPFPFEQLDKLRVCIQEPQELPLAAFAEDSTVRCRAFGNAPILSDVAVDNKVMFNGLFEINWSALDIFCQEQTLPDEFVECYPLSDILSSLIMLSKASSLGSAQFHLHPFDTEYEVEWLEGVEDYMHKKGGIIRNAALTFLVLNGAPGTWRRILSNIELPNLQTLHCHPSLSGFPDPLPAAIGSSLRKLEVHVGGNADTEPIKAFLNMTPALLELKMIFDWFFDIGPMCTIIFRMTPDLVPRLTSLAVTTLGRTRVIIKSDFITALKSRVDGRVSSKTLLKVRVVQSELVVINKMVQEELDSLLLGPDPDSSSLQSIA
ncbi:hypothetical protein BDZ89DRAFT_1111375 [Hymenopellis radicata]|nr:hypothetical protein BDZ89DRAFT_1111375 [Hymenopellis radicata]